MPHISHSQEEGKATLLFPFCLQISLLFHTQANPQLSPLCTNFTLIPATENLHSWLSSPPLPLLSWYVNKHVYYADNVLASQVSDDLFQGPFFYYPSMTQIHSSSLPSSTESIPLPRFLIQTAYMSTPITTLLLNLL